MSSSEVETILTALEPLRAQVNEILKEHQGTKAELAEVKRELAMARRDSTRPYYTTAELMALARKTTPKALYAWANRRGIPSQGHNQWDRKAADAILGIS